MIKLKCARLEKSKKGKAFLKVGDGSMWEKLSVPLIPIVLFAAQPLQVLAQQSQSPNTPQPPQWYGPGPWHMWSDGYGWHFWWMFPMMMLFMMLLCRRHLFSVQPSLRRLAPMGADGSAVGRRLFSTSDTGRALCQRRDSKGRVSGKEGHYSLWSIALIGSSVGRRHGDVQRREKAGPATLER